ncbi:sensor histidine kinase [Roseovarius phycicola]|uniref:histidine kinase n=1 Tax=Roseovarius phycicola TaxID=3080976 RepID=A0ABZ2HIG4_9RHOB
MKSPKRTRVLIILLFLLTVAGAGAGVWLYGYSQALTQLDKQGRADLALASDRFAGEMRRHREIAVLLADHPLLANLAEGRQPGPAVTLLQETADRTGAMALIYTDTEGRILANAGDVALEPAESAYFRRAMNGALGTFFGRLGPDGRRVYAYAAPTFGDDGRVIGSLIALVDIAEVEWDWIGGQPPVFFTDADGRVFVSNRSELLNWRTSDMAAGLFPPDTEGDIIRMYRPYPDVWALNFGSYLPSRALHLSRPKPVIGMTGHVLVDVAPAKRVANLQAAFFAALCLAFGAVLLQLAERRRTLARDNALLESRVAERTAALSQSNTALRHEVVERKEAEAALKKAQAELVQAGKLSALGQMSAGISHELNQPLMAIQQFADNGAALLLRDKPKQAQDNMSRISALAARAARIIKNLRAFVRNENEPMSKVDLVNAIDAAVEMTQSRLTEEGATLDWQAPPTPVYVQGGEVRLGQVFVNLINNAADAMTGQSEKQIKIRIEAGARLAVTVRDTGPGITDPDKIFEPFYSTKEVGNEDGMGLGLSISYGLVQSFGGKITGVNAPDRGAVFTVELDPWQEEAAA